MAVDQFTTEVSRRIEAPADRIFDILANPQRHTDLDGSEMLRGAVSSEMITGAGDVFSMKMYLDEVGDYVMMNSVVEFEVNRCIGWEPAPGDAAATEDGKYPIGVPAGHKWSFHLIPVGTDATIVTEIFDCSSASEELREAVENGASWIESMTTTLARLDTLCTQQLDYWRRPISLARQTQIRHSEIVDVGPPTRTISMSLDVVRGEALGLFTFRANEPSSARAGERE